MLEHPAGAGRLAWRRRREDSFAAAARSGSGRDFTDLVPRGRGRDRKYVSTSMGSSSSIVAVQQQQQQHRLRPDGWGHVVPGVGEALPTGWASPLLRSAVGALGPLRGAAFFCASPHAMLATPHGSNQNGSSLTDVLVTHAREAVEARRSRVENNPWIKTSCSVGWPCAIILSSSMIRNLSIQSAAPTSLATVPARPAALERFACLLF